MVYIPKDPTKNIRQKRSKYKNKRVTAQGRKFDSIIERDRFFFLQDLQRAGKIRNLRTQVEFSMDVNGEHICKYVADFVYDKLVLDIRAGAVPNDHWQPIVEDVKSSPTAKLAVFNIKKKLLRAVHGIEIKIVKSPTADV